MDFADRVLAVFQDGDAQENVHAPENGGGDGGDAAAHFAFAPAVDIIRPVGVAEPDREHLGKTAFIDTPEAGVGLDAVDNHHGVGGKSLLVEPHRHAAVKGGEKARRGTGADWRAGRRLGYPDAGENVELPLRGRAAVTAHGGDEKRLCPAPFQEVDDDSGDARDIGDAAAARRDRHAHAGSDRAGRDRFLEPGEKEGAVVRQGDGWERLLHQRHRRNGHAREQFFDRIHCGSGCDAGPAWPAPR